MKEYKTILNETLELFKDFYTKQVSELGPKFAEKATKSKTQKRNSALEFVEKMNSQIFDDNIEEIKSLMTVAIMET